MQTLMDKEKNRLLKRFHTLLGKTGGNTKAKKEAILESFGVESSKDLDAHELLEICNALDKALKPKLAKSDKLRKRLIAAIAGYLKAMNRESNIKIIKAIACRAAEVDDFNKIPPERLRSLYNAFTKKQKDLSFVDEITKDELNFKIAMN